MLQQLGGTEQTLPSVRNEHLLPKLRKLPAICTRLRGTSHSRVPTGESLGPCPRPPRRMGLSMPLLLNPATSPAGCSCRGGRQRAPHGACPNWLPEALRVPPHTAIHCLPNGWEAPPGSLVHSTPPPTPPVLFSLLP